MAEAARRFFATTSGGLEPFLEGELRGMGAAGVRRAVGGVAFEGDRAMMMRACLELRTAHRVLWVLGELQAPTPEALYGGVLNLARWEGLCPPDRTISVHATSRESRMQDAQFLALKVKDAVVDRVREAVGARPSVSGDPDVRIRVRLHRDRATVGLDAAGVSLHARGYRTEGGEAPLRESLGAAFALASKWDGLVPLCDPMCGSGTLLIEALLCARQIAPGLCGRRYGFERWPGHKPQVLERLLEAARARVRAVPAGVFGADRDRHAVGRAQANAERAGVGEGIAWGVQDVGDAAPVSGPGILVANPPWGERLGADLAFYGELGRALRARYPGWEAWLFLEDPAALEALALPVARRHALRNGSLELGLVQLRVPGAQPGL